MSPAFMGQGCNADGSLNGSAASGRHATQNAPALEGWGEVGCHMEDNVPRLAPGQRHHAPI
jgi:hypothetical protein